MRLKQIICISLITVMSLSTAGCSTSNNNADNNNQDAAAASQIENKAFTFTDDLGYEVTVDNPEKIAAASESLANAFQLAGGTVSATTEDAIESDKLDLPDNVKNIGLLKNPSVEQIINSGADFIIMSGTISGHVDIRDELNKAGITTAYFNIEVFSDYENMMKILTQITGRDDLYKENTGNVRQLIDEQIAKAENPGPTVLLLRAYSQGVTARDSDTMTGAMLKDLGCINIADDKGSFGELSMEAIIQADPDYIFVTTMGNSEEAAIASLNNMLISNPAWNSLKAVKENHYYMLQKDLFHNKPNEKWGQSYEILADILYGEK